MTKAIIQQVPNSWQLWDNDGLMTFYQVTPINGARIEGVFAVRMGSYQKRGVNLPAMLAYICPPMADDNGKAVGRNHPLVVNGKTVEIPNASWVELIPTAPDVEDDVITLGDNIYTMYPRVGGYEGLTDKAYDLVHATLRAVAADYINAERWHAERVREAREKVQAASDKHAAARELLILAMDELDQIRKEK